MAITCGFNTLQSAPGAAVRCEIGAQEHVHGLRLYRRSPAQAGLASAASGVANSRLPFSITVMAGKEFERGGGWALVSVFV